MPRQQLSFLLGLALHPAARRAGLRVLTAINVRLSTGRIVIPDVVVADTDARGEVLDAARVGLIVAVAHPTGVHPSRSQYYADARIEWYLLVEQEPLTMRRLRLDGDHYVGQATVRDGEVLEVDEPFPFRIDPADLAG